MRSALSDVAVVVDGGGRRTSPLVVGAACRTVRGTPRRSERCFALSSTPPWQLLAITRDVSSRALHSVACNSRSSFGKDPMREPSAAPPPLVTTLNALNSSPVGELESAGGEPEADTDELP